MGIAIDPNASAIQFTQASGVTSQAVTISTTNANDIIVVDFFGNGSGPTTVAASGGTGTIGTFTPQTQIFVSGSPNDVVERWYAIATTALSSVTITVTQNSSAFLSICVYAVSGARTTAPIWDPSANMSLTSTPADPFNIQCNWSLQMALASFRGLASGSAGSGWTALTTQNFQIIEYQITGPKLSLPATIGGAPGTNASIGGSLIDQNAVVALTPPGVFVDVILD